MLTRAIVRPRAAVLRRETERAGGAAARSGANPGIQNRVEGAAPAVCEHDARDADEVDALDHRIVALVDRVEQEAAHAGQAEDGLDDDGAADDLRQLRAQERHAGNPRVAGRVLHADYALAQP